MKRTHVRSYRISDLGDVEVVSTRKGDHTDLSKHYEGVSHDRGGVRREASLEVFRFADGQLVWLASPNGQGADSASALVLLLGLYLEDLQAAEGTPRAF